MKKKALIFGVVFMVSAWGGIVLGDQIVVGGDFSSQLGNGASLVAPWDSGAGQFNSYDIGGPHGMYAYTDVTGVSLAQSINNFPGFTLAANTKYDLSADIASWTDDTLGALAIGRVAVYAFDPALLDWVNLAEVAQVHDSASYLNAWESYSTSFTLAPDDYWAGKQAIVVLRGERLEGSTYLLRAQMDNVSLTSSVIPEPASMGVMLFGLAGAVLLRRWMR
jgi:hypothetical protein